MFQAGDPPDFMYVVLAGSVEIRGRARAIERVSRGRALGMGELVDRLRATGAATEEAPVRA